MSNVLIDRQKIDILANAISDKSGVPVTMTLDEMVEAVDGIESNPAPTLQAKTYTVDSAGTETVTADSGYDGLSSVAVSVPTGSIDIATTGYFITINGTQYFRFYADAGIESNNDMGTEGYISDHTVVSDYRDYDTLPSGTSVTPTESSQTIGGNIVMMESAVTVNAIPSNYVGSGITQRSSSDLTASGATVTVPSGYYSAQASKAVASGTAGTPTATKGTVSNHSISVTPSVTNTAGYISGGTINGTAVTVSASELVSGSDTVTTNDTYDVTNLAELIVNVSGGVTVTDVANTTGTTCVITTGSAPSEDIPLNTQLIDFTAIKSGYIVDGDTGEETVSQWSSCSDFTLIDPSMTFSYIGYQWYDIVFYDSSKSYISNITMYQDTGVTITNDYAHGTLTPSKIPSTAKYVRINSYPTNPSSTQLSLIRTA